MGVKKMADSSKKITVEEKIGKGGRISQTLRPKKKKRFLTLDEIHRETNLPLETVKNYILKEHPENFIKKVVANETKYTLKN